MKTLFENYLTDESENKKCYNFWKTSLKNILSTYGLKLPKMKYLFLPNSQQILSYRTGNEISHRRTVAILHITYDHTKSINDLYTDEYFSIFLEPDFSRTNNSKNGGYVISLEFNPYTVVLTFGFIHSLCSLTDDKLLIYQELIEDLNYSISKIYHEENTFKNNLINQNNFLECSNIWKAIIERISLSTNSEIITFDYKLNTENIIYYGSISRSDKKIKIIQLDNCISFKHEFGVAFDLNDSDCLVLTLLFNAYTIASAVNIIYVWMMYDIEYTKKYITSMLQQNFQLYKLYNSK